MAPSFWQILIVAAIVLLLFGPKRIPGLGKSMGEAIRGFKKGLTEDEIDVTDSTKREQLAKDEDTNAKKETEKKKEEEKA